MADSTPNLALPFIKAGQSQKEVTHASGLIQLDAIVQLSVLSRTLSAPPAAPVEGQRWIVGASPTGAWSGRAGQVAGYYQGWRYWTPQPGWIAWLTDESGLAHWTGSAWVTGTSGGVSMLTELSDVGIGTPAAKELLAFDPITGHWVNRRATLADLADVDLATTPPVDGQFAAWLGGKLHPVDAPTGTGGGTGGGTAPASGGPAVQLLLQGYPVDGNGSSTGGAPIIRSQRGIASIDVLAAGAIRLNFSTPFANANFVCALSGQFGVDATDGTGAVVYEPRRAIYNEVTRGPSYLTICGGYNASTTPFFLYLYNVSVWAPPGG